MAKKEKHVWIRGYDREWYKTTVERHEKSCLWGFILLILAILYRIFENYFKSN